MGFIHGERYLITSAFDGTVFDVKKAQTKNAAKVLTWNWSGQPNQMWNANAEKGGFRLAAVHCTGELKVLDQEHNSTNCIIWPYQGNDNQLWNAYPVGHRHDIFIIKNLKSGLCVRNMGRGNQMECTAVNEHDPNVQWRLTRC